MKNVMGFGDFTSSWREWENSADDVVLVDGGQALVCEVCNLELNSEVTFASHIRGSRRVVSSASSKDKFKQFGQESCSRMAISLNRHPYVIGSEM